MAEQKASVEEPDLKGEAPPQDASASSSSSATEVSESAGSESAGSKSTEESTPDGAESAETETVGSSADAPTPVGAAAAPPTAAPEPSVTTEPTGTETPASTETPAAPTRTEPASRSRSKRKLVLSALTVVLLALWVAAGILLHMHRAAVHTEAAHQAALSAAREVATDLTSLGGADPQASIQKLQAQTTGSFREQVTQFNSMAQAMLQQSNAESRGAVTAAAIESGDADHAVALVTVTQMISNNKLPNAQNLNLRLSIQLQREGGAWLASNVTYIP